MPDQLLIKLLEQQQTEETKLAALSVHLGAEHPEVIAARKTLQKLDEQIGTRMNGIIKALELRAVATSSTSLSENNETGSRAAIATVVDEEETEIRRIQVLIRNSPDLINGTAEGYGPLNTAALGGWLRVATFLLDNGADINKPTGGATPLYQAVKSGHKAMVELLAQRGANVNTHDGTGATPLHIAAERGFLAVAEALVQWKADLNSRNSKANGEQTPLHRAAMQGLPAMVTFLISKGAEIEAADASGNRALMLAAREGRTDVVVALLKAGAQVNATNASGATALAFAAGNGNLESIKTLLAANADPNGGKSGPALFNAINNPTVMESLLAAGANPNVTNISGQLLLLSVIQQGDERNVELLIKRGANVNAKNNLRMTPLQMAVWRESIPLVSLLLTNGADVNAEGPAGRNALLMAKEASEGFRPSNPGEYSGINRIPDRATAQRIAALLREHGALDDLPDFTRIEMRRAAANYSGIAFETSTNGWNEFTLLELIARQYGFISTERNALLGSEQDHFAQPILGGGGVSVSRSGARGHPPRRNHRRTAEGDDRERGGVAGFRGLRPGCKTQTGRHRRDSRSGSSHQREMGRFQRRAVVEPVALCFAHRHDFHQGNDHHGAAGSAIQTVECG